MEGRSGGGLRLSFKTLAGWANSTKTGSMGVSGNGTGREFDAKEVAAETAEASPTRCLSSKPRLSSHTVQEGVVEITTFQPKSITGPWAQKGSVLTHFTPSK